MTVDLNADVGEGPGEEPLYALVTSVNVACGGHAGDDASMARAVRLAAAHGVAVGAHPSYPDREGFGRRTVDLPVPALARSVREQVERLRAIGAVRHVKPHGALYHDAWQREEIADAIARAVDPELVLVGPAGSPAIALWRRRGRPVAAEGFADRAYEPDGRLRARRHPGAVIVEPRRAAEQALRLVRAGGIDTLCVHADTPGAAEILLAVRGALGEAGIEVAARATSIG